jgi:hypothetical protein
MEASLAARISHTASTFFSRERSCFRNVKLDDGAQFLTLSYDACCCGLVPADDVHAQICGVGCQGRERRFSYS